MYTIAALSNANIVCWCILSYRCNLKSKCRRCRTVRFFKKKKTLKTCFDMCILLPCLLKRGDNRKTHMEPICRREARGGSSPSCPQLQPSSPVLTKTTCGLSYGGCQTRRKPWSRGRKLDKGCRERGELGRCLAKKSLSHMHLVFYSKCKSKSSAWQCACGSRKCDKMD